MIIYGLLKIGLNSFTADTTWILAILMSDIEYTYIFINTYNKYND